MMKQSIRKPSLIALFYRNGIHHRRHRYENHCTYQLVLIAIVAVPYYILCTVLVVVTIVACRLCHLIFTSFKLWDTV